MKATVNDELDIFLYSHNTVYCHFKIYSNFNCVFSSQVIYSCYFGCQETANKYF